MAVSMIVERRFVYGLALYFRQLELSLHGCYVHEWEELIQLISNSCLPSKVLDAVLWAQARYGVSDNAPSIVIRRCLCALRIRTRAAFVTSQEIEEVCDLLRELIRMFDADYPERDDLSRIRLRFATMVDRLQFRLGWPPDEAAYSIAHIGQAPQHPTFPLPHFVGREWPDMVGFRDVSAQHGQTDEKDCKYDRS